MAEVCVYIYAGVAPRKTNVLLTLPLASACGAFAVPSPFIGSALAAHRVPERLPSYMLSLVPGKLKQEDAVTQYSLG